jgi:hypothetical protein
VVVFLGSRRGLGPKPDWTVQAEEPNTFFGDCTHPTGDLNGDGFDDLAVGAYGFDDGRGRIRLFYGGPQGLAAAPAWVSEGEAKHDWYGYGIGAAGDVNGDGIGDLIAGAKYNDQAGHDAGKAYLYLGARTGPAARPDWTWFGPGAEANATVRITGVGDVNGDGFDDVMVTAPRTKGDGDRFYLFYGGAKGLSAAPDQSIRRSDPKLEFFGEGACPAGDLDGDGYDDLAVHGRAADGYGEVFIYRGGAKGLEPRPRWVLRGESAADRFGWWVAPAGDLDGDGRPDLVVSAESHGRGAVYVYLGRQFGPSGGRTPKHPLNGYLHPTPRKV